MDLKKIASWVMEDLFNAMDADDAHASGSSPADPPDIVAHDRKYHKGHWDGRGKCKYREDRAAALTGVSESQAQQDIIDRLTPEDVAGEEIDKADDLSVASTAGGTLHPLAEKLDSPLAKRMKSRLSKLTPGSTSYENIVSALNKMAGVPEQVGENPSAETTGAAIPDEAKANSGAAAGGGASHRESQDDINMAAMKSANDMGASWAYVPKPQSAGVAAGMSDIDANIAKATNPLLKALLERGRSRYQKVNGAEDRAAKIEALKKFAEFIGLDLDTLGGVLAGKSSGEPGSLKDSIDRVRSMMNMASPRLAAILQSGLADLAAGKDPGKASTDRNEDEKKSGRLPGPDKRKPMIRTAMMALDSAPQAGKTSALSHADFEKAFASLPADKKIKAISDIHRLDYDADLDIPDDGICILAGDISDKLSTSESGKRGIKDAIEVGKKFLKRKLFPFFEKHPKTKFVVIPGNHDHVLGSDAVGDIKWPSNVSFLSDSACDLNGMKFYGTGACTRRPGLGDEYFFGKYCTRYFELKDDDLKKKYDQIPDGLDVLVVHQPPASDHAGHGFKYGSSYLTEIIKQKKPKLVICGHIHENDHRPFQIGDSVVMNAASVLSHSDPSRAKFDNKTGTFGLGKTYSGHDIGIHDGGFFVDGENLHTLI